MTDLADRTIALLRRQHDELAALAQGLSDDDLARPSGASEWPVAQVLSHLGSAAEIFLGILRKESPDNQAIWARWDASSPREQAEGFLEHDERLVAALEALDDETRTTSTVDVGFLPEPVPFSTFVGMRSVEVVMHSWDARVGLDDAAVVDEEAAGLLAEHYAGGLGFMLGFAGKADRLGEPATVVVGASGYGIVVDGGVRLTATPGSAPTATFQGPLESAVRLIGGRLNPTHTPDGVDVTGNVTLDDLREVFPGY